MYKILNISLQFNNKLYIDIFQKIFKKKMVSFMLHSNLHNIMVLADQANVLLHIEIQCSKFWIPKHIFAVIEI